jgi:Mrp family chromosome partitioning ATPase
MSKLFEAMEQVQRNRSSTSRSAAVSQLRVVPPRTAAFDAEMLSLYRSLESHFGDLARKVILFLGVGPGEGTSTVVSNLAHVAAEQFNRKVAVLDAGNFSPVEHRLLEFDRKLNSDEALKSTQEREQAMYAAAEKRITMVPVSLASAGTAPVIDGPRIQALLAALRDRFDLILVDCAPATVSPDTVTLSPKADGVVLVLAAESTRWPVAQNVSRQVERVGGRIAGVVLNRRRYYIPGSIYARL